MTTDPLFYRLFQDVPEMFFLLLGLPRQTARETAARYEFKAVEYKETSHRADGVFLPRQEGEPIYFVEVQYYRKPAIYADLLAKAYTHLKQNDPAQEFCAVVLFAERSLEPSQLRPYQALIDSGQLRRYYLDEMVEQAGGPLELSVLFLIRENEVEAPRKASDLIARVKAQVDEVGLRRVLIELIETVIIYKLPQLTREEVQAMLHVDDVRNTRVYQEGRAEGVEEGRAEGRAEGKAEGRAEGLEQAASIIRMDARGMSAREIAESLALPLAKVEQLLAVFKAK
jgi:predicted transposase/invertase (TIGR01784 family)